jgi:MftR C-terminal domain
VLELARRATRALAAASVARPGRRLTRERLIASTPALLARRMAKNLRWEQAIAERLVDRGVSEEEALLLPKVALACFQAAYERWLRDPRQDLPALVDQSFVALTTLQTPDHREDADLGSRGPTGAVGPAGRGGGRPGPS